MRDLIEIKNYEVLAGANINEVAEEAVFLAKENNCLIVFQFNSAELRVYNFMQPKEIVDEYYREINRRIK
jgi:hypothetical protein